MDKEIHHLGRSLDGRDCLHLPFFHHNNEWKCIGFLELQKTIHLETRSQQNKMDMISIKIQNASVSLQNIRKLHFLNLLKNCDLCKEIKFRNLCFFLDFNHNMSWNIGLPAVTPSMRLSALWSITSAMRSAPILRLTLNKDTISFLQNEERDITNKEKSTHIIHLWLCTRAKRQLRWRFWRNCQIMSWARSSWKTAKLTSDNLTLPNKDCQCNNHNHYFSSLSAFSIIHWNFHQNFHLLQYWE